MGEMHQKVTQCRICKGTRLERYIDLGLMPLVNKHLDKQDGQNEPKFPLDVLFCNDCAASQLSVVVDPSALFSHYVYRSSVSQTFADHCFELAKDCEKKLGMKKNDLVIDIASNDGCSLKEFAKLGVRPLGVDPAENLAEIANRSGIPTLAKFWSPDIADEIVRRHGKAKIITAMNVFAHVHDVHSFVEGVKRSLADDGTFIIECPYMVDLVNTSVFDTIYHEHLSYFLISPLVRLFKEHGLSLNRIERIPIHGGTVRLFVQRREAPDASVRDLLELEKSEGFLSFEKYRALAQSTEKIKTELRAMVQKLKSEGKRIAGFGASAKGCIMLNYCGLTQKDIDFIVDDTPEKQNKFFAGVRIPIVPREALASRKPDYLLVLAWNFFDEIRKKTAAYEQAGGKYVLPVPSPQVI
jgi:SAM-dependent methyltransferase